MLRRAILGTVVALALVGAGIAIGSHGDRFDGWGRETVVVHGGTGAQAADTVVVAHGGQPPFFLFPFGFLFVVLLVVCVARLTRRGRGPRGHWAGPSGSMPAWFEDWHARVHDRDAGKPEAPRDDS